MSETDDDEEYLEKMYITQNFGNKKGDDKHAKELQEQYEKEEGKDPSGLNEEEKEEVDAYQTVLGEAQEKNDLTQVYKLFNTVCQSSSNQVLRYMQPSIYRDLQVTPLWASANNIVKFENVPVCPHCNKPRNFEL